MERVIKILVAISIVLCGVMVLIDTLINGSNL